MKSWKKNLSTRKISEIAVSIAVVSCLLGAIWSPEESVKWVCSAIYISAVGRWFGLTYRKEKVINCKIIRESDTLDFTPGRVKF